jgi:hypothetical protein
MQESLSASDWTKQPFIRVFPIPEAVTVGTQVWFDAVIFNAKPGTAVVELFDPAKPSSPVVTLPLTNLGASYYRAIFEPKDTQNILWRFKAIINNGQKLYYPPKDETMRPLVIIDSR